MRYLGLLLFCVFSLSALAEVRVAFVEVKGYGGQQIQLEKDGRFAHVAISYRGLWLQALPKNGVELVPYADLAKSGKIVMLKSVNEAEPSQEFVDSVLGRGFEMGFSWDSEEYYCSKLVAKILDLTPSPMDFSTRVWPPSFKKYQGLPGISPDDVFEQLLERRFVQVTGKKTIKKCEGLL